MSKGHQISGVQERRCPECGGIMRHWHEGEDCHVAHSQPSCAWFKSLATQNHTVVDDVEDHEIPRPVSPLN